MVPCDSWNQLVGNRIRKSFGTPEITARGVAGSRSSLSCDKCSGTRPAEVRCVLSLDPPRGAETPVAFGHSEGILFTSVLLSTQL